MTRAANALPARVEKGTSPAAVNAKVATVAGISAPIVSPPPDAGPLIETEEITSTVFRCVQAISEDCASVPLKLMDYSGAEPQEILEHDALRLFQHINANEIPEIWWQQTVADLLTEGNSFSWIDVFNGVPVNTLRMKPQQVDILPDPKKIVRGYRWTDDKGARHDYPRDEILHLRTRAGSTPYRGLSPLYRLRDPLLLEREMLNWNYYRFKNNIPTTLLMKTTKVFEDEAEVLKLAHDIQNRLAGAERAGKPLIMSEGEWEISTIERPNDSEIGYHEGLVYIRAVISMVFGVPPTKLMYFDDAFRANAEEQERMYWLNTVMSWHRLILGWLNADFLPRFFPSERNLRFEFEYSGVRALAKSSREIAEENEIAVRGGWRTRNEARAAEGSEEYTGPGREHADELLVPTGFMPLEQVGELQKKLIDDAGKPKDKEEDDKRDRKGKVQEEEEEEEKGMTIPSLTILHGNPPDVTKLVNRKKEIERLRKAVREIIFEIARVAGEQHLQQSGIAGVFNILDPAVIEFIATQSILLSQFANDTTIERLREVVARNTAEGTPVESMRNDIRALFKERRAFYELDRISRTEVHQAQEGGSFHAAKQHGIEYKRWISSRDEKVRGNPTGKYPKTKADHHELDNQIKKMDEFFIDPRDGARLMYPGDVSKSPDAKGHDVINCRCTWVSHFPKDGEGKAATFVDFDEVWQKKQSARDTFEKAMRAILHAHWEGMEYRVLQALDQETGRAAA